MSRVDFWCQAQIVRDKLFASLPRNVSVVFYFHGRGFLVGHNTISMIQKIIQAVIRRDFRQSLNVFWPMSTEYRRLIVIISHYTCFRHRSFTHRVVCRNGF